MRTQTKVIALGAVIMVLLTGVIVMSVFDDIEGPLVYQIDVLPVAPAPGDSILVVIYCIDRSGISAAELSSSINGEEWQITEMQFYSCLCIAGGRWTASFGPLEQGDTAEFFVTAYDASVSQNAADSQTFEIIIEE